MKSLIIWDKNIFDGEKRLLPSTKVLYTQIHLPQLKESWSIVFKFNIAPRDQGYRTIADEVFFCQKKPRTKYLKKDSNLTLWMVLTLLENACCFKKTIRNERCNR